MISGMAPRATFSFEASMGESLHGLHCELAQDRTVSNSHDCGGSVLQVCNVRTSHEGVPSWRGGLATSKVHLSSTRVCHKWLWVIAILNSLAGPSSSSCYGRTSTSSQVYISKSKDRQRRWMHSWSCTSDTMWSQIKKIGWNWLM